MRRCSSLPYWFPFLLAVLGANGAARAQISPSEKAAAEALFDQGIALMEANRLAEACAKLEQSQAIERGIGTMLYLAECYEKTGRTASAWALFREAASEAQAAGQLDRARAGTDRAARLEPKLSRLTIVVTNENPVDVLEVLRNGQQIRRALWSVPVPVDPGEHRIEARAPGRIDWAQTVKVGKDGSTVGVTVPPLALGPSNSQTTAESPSPAAPAPASPAAPDTTGSGSFQKTAGLVTACVGGVAVGVGAFFGVRAMSKNGDAEDLCPGGECTSAEGPKLTEDARDAARLANVFVIGGAVVAAAGVVLYLTAPDEPTRVGVRAAPAGALVSWEGAW